VDRRRFDVALSGRESASTRPSGPDRSSTSISSAPPLRVVTFTTSYRYSVLFLFSFSIVVVAARLLQCIWLRRRALARWLSGTWRQHWRVVRGVQRDADEIHRRRRSQHERQWQSDATRTGRHILCETVHDIRLISKVLIVRLSFSLVNDALFSLVT
jgi:hypothetical protein